MHTDDPYQLATDSALRATPEQRAPADRMPTALVAPTRHLWMLMLAASALGAGSTLQGWRMRDIPTLAWTPGQLLGSALFNTALLVLTFALFRRSRIAACLMAAGFLSGAYRAVASVWGGDITTQAITGGMLLIAGALVYRGVRAVFAWHRHLAGQQ